MRHSAPAAQLRLAPFVGYRERSGSELVLRSTRVMAKQAEQTGRRVGASIEDAWPAWAGRQTIGQRDRSRRLSRDGAAGSAGRGQTRLRRANLKSLPARVAPPPGLHCSRGSPPPAAAGAQNPSAPAPALPVASSTYRLPFVSCSDVTGECLTSCWCFEASAT